jgi:hypothetical protein
VHGKDELRHLRGNLIAAIYAVGDAPISPTTARHVRIDGHQDNETTPTSDPKNTGYNHPSRRASSSAKSVPTVRADLGIFPFASPPLRSAPDADQSTLARQSAASDRPKAQLTID